MLFLLLKLVLQIFKVAEVLPGMRVGKGGSRVVCWGRSPRLSPGVLKQQLLIVSTYCQCSTDMQAGGRVQRFAKSGEVLDFLPASTTSNTNIEVKFQHFTLLNCIEVHFLIYLFSANLLYRWEIKKPRKQHASAN